MANIRNVPNIQMGKDFMREHYNLCFNPLTSDPCTNVKEYVERTNEIKRFERDLNLLSISTPCSYLVIGDKGLGKTSFVNICMQTAQKYGLKTIYISNVPRNAGQFMKNLLLNTMSVQTKERITRSQREYISSSSAKKEPYRVFDIWAEVMEGLEPKPVVVVIDETDNLPKISQIAPLFNNYIFSQAKNVIFFLCALPEIYKEMHETMGAFIDRFPLVIDIPPFSKEELMLCLKKKLSSARTDKESMDIYHPFDTDAINVLLEYANGVPRYMLEIAREAIQEGVSNENLKINKKIIVAAASRVQRSTLDKTWLHLTYMEKETLVKMVELGGDMKLVELANALNKTKGTIVPYLNKLDACGLIERVGKKPADIIYKVIVDAESIKRLGGGR